MPPKNFQELSNFIWSVADLLRGPYRPPQYERVMLPMTVLRRFDCVLKPSKQAVLKRLSRFKESKVKNFLPVLNVFVKDAGGKARITSSSSSKRRSCRRPFVPCLRVS